MFQKQTFGSTNTGFGSFNAGASTSSPFSGFKPATGATGFGAPPAFGANATPQPAQGGGLFGSTNTTGGLFGGNTATSTGFGATSGFGFGATTASGGLFNNSSSGLFGNNQNNSAFGAKPATGFGFGATANTNTTGGLFGSTPSTSTGLFGQQNTSIGGGLFGNTSGGFGQQQATGTAVVKYNPVAGTDVVVKAGTSTNVNIKHHCITCMKEYESKSLEELRLEDYLAGRKGPSGVFGFQQPENKPLFGGTSTFGQPATTSAPSLFGSSISSTPAFGQTNTFSFGGGTQTNTQTMGLFGANKPAFGATPTPGTGLFAATTTQAPAFGTNTSTFGFGANTQNQICNMAQEQTSGSTKTGLGVLDSANIAGGLLGGNTATSTAFGAPTASEGLLSNSSSRLFGNNQNNSAFGAKPATDNAEEVRTPQDNFLRPFNIVTKNNHLKSEVHDRKTEFKKLLAVFKKFIPESQQLKNQHEIDCRAIQKVMQQAGEWYQQNKQLQRKCTALMLALPSGVKPDLDATDAASDTSSNEEVEFLKRTISELSEQVAVLQTNAIKNSSDQFYSDATIIQVAVWKKLEKEKEKCAEQTKEIQQLRNRLERHNRVSKLMVEMSELKNNADKNIQMAETYKSEVSKVNKHVKILMHQSALELGERLGLQQDEKDAMQDALEEQGVGNGNIVEDLQLKKAEKHEDTVILSWEEKIKLAEEDAQKALGRAEGIKKMLEELEREHAEDSKSRNHKLMSKIKYYKTGIEKEIKIELTGDSIGATVDQIKGLKFQLKSTDQNILEKPKDDQPEAVKDMMQMLGILRDKRHWRNVKKLASEQES